MFTIQRSPKTAVLYYLRSITSNRNRRCSTYGIETKQGIYEIKKRPDVTQQTLLTPSPRTLLDNKYVKVYCCSHGDAIEQSFSLHKLDGQFHNSKTPCMKGFIRNSSYRPSLVHLSDETVETDHILASGLSKVVFEQTREGYLRLIKGDETNNGEMFTIEKLSGTHPVFSNPNFMPVYKTFEQARENLSKVYN